MVFDGTLKFDTSIDKSGFEAGIAKLGSLAAKGMKLVAGAVTAAAGGLSVFGTKALTAYADFEQLTGGVATLFGAQDMSLQAYAQSFGKSVDAVRGEYDRLIAAQNDVMQNASKAFQTAGLSQNAYMETVTSFSAALISSLDGDTAKAAQVADRAIVDMADNANKMGSSMESIQNAYQGFAKQNYTMLDNLKLGYGGTKSEMERLLADAQKISGIKYNLESYADIVEAIHVIQTEMHISGISAEEAAELVASGALTEEEAFTRMGTTAKEAATTIQGSVSAVKASFSNLLVGIADDTQDFDRLVDNFVSSAATAAENIVPRIGTIIGGTGKLISSMSGVAADLVVGLTGYLPEIISAGVAMVGKIAEGLKKNALAIAEAAFSAGRTLLDGILSIGGDLLELGGSLLFTLAEGISERLPDLLNRADEIITKLADSLQRALPRLIPLASGIIVQLVRGITSRLPEIVRSASQIILTLATGLADAIPSILPEIVTAFLGIAEALTDPDVLSALADGAVALMIGLADGLIDALPRVIEQAPVIIENLITALVQNAPKLLNAAIEIIAKLGEALTDPMTLIALGKAAFEIIEALFNALIDVLGELVSIGADILEVIWNGIVENLGKTVEWAGEILGAFCDAIADGWNTIVDAGKNLIIWIGEGIGNIFKTAWDWAADLINGIIDCIAMAWNWLVHCGENIIRWIVDGLGNLWEKGKQWMNDIWEGMKSAWTAFWEWLKARGQDIVSALNPINWLGENNAVKNLVEGMEKDKGTLANAAADLAKVQADYLHHSTPEKGPLKDDDQWGSDFVQNIIDGMENKRSDLSRTAEEIAGIPAEYLHHSVPEKGPLHDDNKWGSELAKNLIDGINSRQQEVAQCANALANGIADVFRNTVDSAYLWGLDLMQGLANGIAGGISIVQNAAASVAGSVAAYLHFSRPETGPLHSYEQWMPDFIHGLAEGIYSNLAVMTSAVQALSDVMQPSLSIPDSAVQALRAQPSGAGLTFPAESAVNNYYNTIYRTSADSAQQPVIHVHVHADVEMDGDKIAEKVAEKVDILQGETVEFEERGTAH